MIGREGERERVLLTISRAKFLYSSLVIIILKGLSDTAPWRLTLPQKWINTTERDREKVTLLAEGGSLSL